MLGGWPGEPPSLPSAPHQGWESVWEVCKGGLLAASTPLPRARHFNVYSQGHRPLGPGQARLFRPLV